MKKDGLAHRALRECPYCDKPPALSFNGPTKLSSNNFWIYCRSCGISTGMADSEGHASKIWKAISDPTDMIKLPRKLVQHALFEGRGPERTRRTIGRIIEKLGHS